MAPFAPHVCEELWQRLGHDGLVMTAPWPSYDESLLTEESKTIAVQVLGKTRGTVDVPLDAPEDAVTEAARQLERVQAAMEGKALVKTIFVPNRIINFIVK